MKPNPQVGDIWLCIGDLNKYYVLVLEQEYLPFEAEYRYLCMRLSDGKHLNLSFRNDEWQYILQ